MAEVATLKATALLCAAVLCLVVGPAHGLTTWSGGHAGIGLNGSGFEIYSATCPDGGHLNHFWLTGGNRSIIDNAIVTFYVDGQPTIQFQPNMAAGVGFVDNSSPCTPGNCAEKNSNWGNAYIGKGSGMGGWYNDFRVPFGKTFRATISAHETVIKVPGSTCHIENNVDYWGNDLPGQQIPHVASVDDCCSLCQKNPDCTAFTWHPANSPSGADYCFLKSSSAGRTASIGNHSGTVDTWRIRQGVDFWGWEVPGHGNGVAASSAQDCLSKCTSTSGCAAFTYHDGRDPVSPNLCFLKTSSRGAVPSATTVYSGCRDCEPVVTGDTSVFVLVRGSCGPMQVQVGGFTLPPQARAVGQYRWDILKPLDYYNIVDVASGNGLVAMSTLAIVSGDANFMEGCFHFFQANASFPGEIMATGTEDYYNSGYYFIDAVPQHLPSTGLTVFDNFNTPFGNLTSGLKWSAYRLHVQDPLGFESGGRLTWRNGDVADAGVGKCHHQGQGPPVGNPTVSFVRSFALVYVW